MKEVIDMTKNLDNKTTWVQLRVSESQKRGLQELARRKGLVMSQVLRNYIDDLLDKELASPVPSSHQDKLNETSSESTFTFRCSKELQKLFRTACQRSGLRASGHLRTFMQDFAYLLLNQYPQVPHSAESRLAYLQMFLKNEMQKRGLQYEDTWGTPSHLPDDTETPIIEMITPFDYNVYDSSEGVIWHLKFNKY